jgi:hypothetical protein
VTEQLPLTLDPLADAIAWRDANPEAFSYFLQVALDDIDRGFHPSADFCGHMVRRSGLLTRKPGEPVVFNDRLTSALARLLRRDYDIPFQLRRAKVDGYGAVGGEAVAS